MVDDAAEVDIEALVVIRWELRAASNAQGSIPPGDAGPGNISAMLRDGIELRRSLARRFPKNPEAHNELGSFLGMAGKNLRIRRLVVEGVMECKIAAQLLPNWDGPAVECGIMLANIGEYDTALRELGQARATLPEETPHLRFVTGYVLMMLERFRRSRCPLWPPPPAHRRWPRSCSTKSNAPLLSQALPAKMSTAVINWLSVSTTTAALC